DSPVNPNAKTTVIQDDSEDEADEAKKEVEPSSSKQTKKVRINVSLVDVLAGMPNYGKFLKDLVSNKSKMEQISIAFLNEECSLIIQNNIPPKLGDPGSFFISCIVAGSVDYLALANLGASINLMLYSLYASLSGNTLKSTRMSIRLANHTYQYPIGILENMLVQVGKFIFPADFVILQMEEDDKNWMDYSMIPNHFPPCQKRSANHLSTMKSKNSWKSKSKKSLSKRKRSGIISKNYPLEENLRIKNSIQDPPTDLVMKPLPKHLEYGFIEKDFLLLVVISALLKDDEKKHLVSVLKKHKEAFAWKNSDILGISPSFCKHKIKFKDDAKPVIQRQCHVNPNMKEVVRKEIIKLLDIGIIYPSKIVFG
nr:reverse transcriptase domain-containing protein [Tanacetum cinerariifolium]